MWLTVTGFAIWLRPKAALGNLWVVLLGPWQEVLGDFASLREIRPLRALRRPDAAKLVWMGGGLDRLMDRAERIHVGDLLNLGE